jgi:hypothetical protein
LSAEQALDEFIELSDSILEKQEMDAPSRTTALRAYIDKLLEKHGVGKETRLQDTSIRSKGSKMWASYHHFDE